MLIILVSGVLAIASIVVHLIGVKTERVTISMVGAFLGIMMLVPFIVFCTSATIIQANKEIDFQNTIYEKKTIEYRIAHKEDNLVGNEWLYNDIVDFNNKLRNTKYWSQNPWTNWLYNDRIAEIGYIEYEFAAAG